jgi:hypothetical protein
VQNHFHATGKLSTASWYHPHSEGREERSKLSLIKHGGALKIGNLRKNKTRRLNSSFFLKTRNIARSSMSDTARKPYTMSRLMTLGTVLLLCNMTVSSTPPASSTISWTKTTHADTILCFLSPTPPQTCGSSSRSTSTCPTSGGTGRRPWWRKDLHAADHVNNNNNRVFHIQRTVLPDHDNHKSEGSHATALHAKKHGGDGVKKPSKEKLEKLKSKEEGTKSTPSVARSPSVSGSSPEREAPRVAPNIGISVKTQIKLVKAAEVRGDRMCVCVVCSCSRACVCVCVCVCTRTDVHEHTRTDVHKHLTHALPDKNSCMHIRTHMCICAYSCTHKHACTHTHAYAIHLTSMLASVHVCMQMHLGAYILATEAT